ncbi:hypothetical protein [Cupriavidus campinensis]|nr:hypothetical protein [Cupriavidus campinensis]
MKLIRNLFRRIVEFCRDPYKGAREQADREIKAIEEWVKAGAPEEKRPWR